MGKDRSVLVEVRIERLGFGLFSFLSYFVRFKFLDNSMKIVFYFLSLFR